MTKKSEARQQRDKIKNLQCNWSELDNLKNDIVQQFSLFTVIDSFYGNEHIMAFVKPEDAVQLTKDVETLVSDINKISVEMKSIYEQYKEKTGKISSIEDYWSYIAIGEAYVKQAAIIEASILPTFQNIMGVFQLAEIKLKEAQEAAAAEAEKDVVANDVGTEATA